MSDETSTYTLSCEGLNLEVITDQADDLDFLNVVLPLLKESNLNSSRLKLVKRNDGLIEVHNLDQEEPSLNVSSSIESADEASMMSTGDHDDHDDDNDDNDDNDDEHVQECQFEQILTDGDCPFIDGSSNMKRQTRLQRDIQRKRRARARETDLQKMIRLEKDRKRKQEARAQETLEQRTARLAKDRARVTRRRLMETDNERVVRLERNRNVKRRSRLRDASLQKLTTDVPLIQDFVVRLTY